MLASAAGPNVLESISFSVVTSASGVEVSSVVIPSTLR
jgi:hypothetical protein